MAAVSRADLARALSDSELFADLSAETLARLAARARPRRLSKGQLAFRQGDPGDCLYVVASGRVRLLVLSPAGDEVLLETVGAGGSFGEVAILDGGARSTTAQASEPTLLAAVDRAAFLQLLREEPSLAGTLLELVGRLVRRLTDRAVDLVVLDLPARVAKLLLSLADHDRDPPTVTAPPTQGELARMVAGARQSVNQVLGQFTERGLITVRDGVIELTDPAGLRARAGG